MPSLIGTAPNQVPVNAMLGSAAYQDVNNFAVETKTFGDNSNFAASTKFVQTVKNSLEKIYTTTTGAVAGVNYNVTVDNPPSSYYDGFFVKVKIHTNQVSGAPSFNVNSLGNVSIAAPSTTPPDGTNSSLRANMVCTFVYLGGTFYAQELNFADNTQLLAGTATNTGITPKGLRTALNATGSAPIYACRAWVNFNGTGTVAIRASGNVTSVTDNGTGDYTVNLTSALEDANYSVAGISSEGVSGGTGISGTFTFSTTSFRFSVIDTSDNSNKDVTFITLSFFR